MTEPYRCPTPCDPDCEINGWGCHEAHAMPVQRVHEPEACEARALAGNLRWLVDNGWQFQFGRLRDRLTVQPYWAHLVNCSLKYQRQDGVSLGDVAFMAREWAEARQAPATTTTPQAADCRGFRWIGQSFASCDGCGRPAWEHDGMRRLREGAKLLFGGGEDDWELIPWKPGEAEAIKRKWAR